MDILVKQVLVIDPSSPFHRQTIDIFIQNGYITETGSISRSADREISINGLIVSPGWTEVFSNFCDPGFEFKETLETGAVSAARGGFTDVMVVPNTLPVVHSKGGVEYVVQRSKSLLVNIHPIGAVTKNAEGKELAEMYDMHASGAVAFGDGVNTIQSSGIVLKALQYVKAINKTIIQLPDEKSVSGSGLMNEGIVSTQLGLAGKPALAEELLIARDLELAQYSDSKIHFTGISTARSLRLIGDAKKQGISVTCSTTPFHLFFCDEDLVTYDTNLKVNPPLRTKEDRQALKEGVLNGIVDCIATHHFPHEKDTKVLEFEYAKEGMIGLETTFGIIRAAVPDLPIEKIAGLMSINPRKLFDLPQITIANNAAACLTLFHPDIKWTVGEMASKSKNSPYYGYDLNGRSLGIINKDKVFLNEY